MRIHRDERGQTIILIALSLPLLLGFVGIATDVGALFKNKRTMQTAADAAAIAGALNLNSSTQVTAAKAAATANGFTDGSNGVVVTVHDPPTWPASNYGSSTGTPNGYVEVTITKPEPTIFLTLFGYPSVNVLARAVATNGAGGGSMYALSPTGTGLSVNSVTVLGGGGIIVDSSDSNAMNVTSGPVNAASIGIVGGCTTCAGTTFPTAVSGIIPYSDPLSFLTPPAAGGSCTNLNATGGTVVLFPGCYSTFNITGANVTMNPGTYVVNAPSMTLVGGTLTGTGITFYIGSGTLAINGTTLNISAPIGGPFNGILFDQSPTNSNDASIIGSANSNTQGFFYFPASSLQLNGPFGTLYAGFVAKSISIASSTFTFNTYASMAGNISPIPSAVLVE